MKPVYKLPDRAFTARVRGYAQCGMNKTQIARVVTGDHRRMRKTVAVIAADVWQGHDRFDPVDDEVAIQRALQGDTAVWNGLTHYERREALCRFLQRYEADREESAYWSALADRNGGTTGRTVDMGWAADLAHAWGFGAVSDLAASARSAAKQNA